MHRAVYYLPNRKVLRGGNGCAQRGGALRASEQATTCLWDGF